MFIISIGGLLLLSVVSADSLTVDDFLVCCVSVDVDSSLEGVD